MRAGLSLLDVGSGPGTITVDLAERVAPGPVTAMEATEAALAVTRAEFDRRGCTSARLVTGDIHNLPFPSGSFNVVHAHQVLQHVADPVAALREMVRVCRPGGVVAVRDGDLQRLHLVPGPSPVWTGGESCTRPPPEGTAASRMRDDGCWHGPMPRASRMCRRHRQRGATRDPASREAWGGTWADRIANSAITGQLLTSGLGTQEDINEIAAAWREWAAHPDGWISILHGELLIRVP